MPNKWEGLDTEKFWFEDLGRSAIFLIPVAKLQIAMDGKTVEKSLFEFLVVQFGAFTYSTVSNFGVWVDGKQVLVYDECRLYDVAFVGKERIPMLADKLVDILQATGEACMFFKAGQYASLIHPRVV